MPAPFPRHCCGHRCRNGNGLPPVVSRIPRDLPPAAKSGEPMSDRECVALPPTALGEDGGQACRPASPVIAAAIAAGTETGYHPSSPASPAISRLRGQAGNPCLTGNALRNRPPPSAKFGHSAAPPGVINHGIHGKHGRLRIHGIQIRFVSCFALSV